MKNSVYVNDKINETRDSISMDINSLDIDDLKLDGFTVRSGNKILKLVVQEETEISNEDDIREELKRKVSQRLMEIGEKIKKKLDDMSNYVSVVKSEYESKKIELDKKMNSSNIMPDITFTHAEQGLSLSKSNESGRLLWLVQSVYWPKFIDDSKIDPKYSKRLINHIIITIETSGKKVMNVGVKTPIGLADFNHYHRNCWGNWKFPKRWETPDDIIEIAHQAEVVLETINTGSLVTSSPRGLMRVSTLEKHSTLMEENPNTSFTSNKRSEQMGINDNFIRDDVWSTL